MTSVRDIQDLAADVQTVRHDWQDIVPIVNFLLPWRHVPYDDLRAMTLAWVGDSGNRTPASLKYMPGVPAKKAGGSSSGRKSKEPTCYICGRSRSDCQKLHDFEVEHGIPDPHIFETHEEADANTGKVQFDPTMLALAAMPRVNEYEESDERKSAKARARAAVDQARQKSAWQPAPPPSDRRIQQPEQQETPA